MNEPKVVFAIYDTTSYRCLWPVAKRLQSEASVEFLLFDKLLKMGRQPLPREKLSPHRDAIDYVKNPVSKKINQITRQQPIPELIIQRLLEDNISYRFSYDISGYIDDTDLDVFVSAHDILPFIKHLIEASHESEFKSVVVQHGMNRPFLENPSEIPGVPKPLSPSVEPRSRTFEYLKRRLGFRHGPFVFCNPYVDELYTFGEFFTEHIASLRNQYPNFGKTDVFTTGSTEFNPDGVEEVNPTIDSVLFLSQWQYENGDWDDEQQREIVDMLAEVADRNDLPLTVRPHPKDSDKKLEEFFEEFRISRNTELVSDVQDHDLVLTVDSTAIFRAVLEGKVCGVVQPPWEPTSFEPFTHDHILQITADNTRVPDEAKHISVETQRSYLDRCCYVPALESSTDCETPAEYIAQRILQL